MKHLLTIVSLLSFAILGYSQCAIKELSVTPTACNVNGEFFVTINFLHTGTTNQFTLKGNGKDYGKYTYDKLPVKIGPLKADCVTKYEFVVRDAINTECLAFKDLGTKCCNDKCLIQFTNVETDTCKGSTYGLYYSVKNETAENSEGFVMWNNGVRYDTFAYNKRVQIPALPSDNFETFNTIVICDYINANCCDTLKILNPCICSIYDIRTQVVDCNEENEQFDIRFDFKYNMVSDSFIIGGNSQTYGKFAYKDLPVKLNNLPFMGNVPYEFLILDNKDAFCFTTYELGIVEECRFDCGIDDVVIKKGDCVGDSIYLWLSFKNKNGSLEGFTIKGNGQVYGNFEYGQDRYRLGPFLQDCEKRLEFIVQDRTMNECRSEGLFNQPLCCDCQISGLEIEEICDGDKLIAFDIDVDHYNTTGNFSLFINNVKIGTYSFANLPVKITNLTGLGQTIAIKIFDAENEACRLLSNYTFKCKPATAECVFDGLTFKASDCNTDKKFFVILKFVAANAGDKGFGIKINGVWLDTIKYNASNAYEIGPLKGDCSTIYSFVVQDIAKPDCRKEFRFLEPICCGEAANCALATPTVSFSPCVDGKYTLTLNFMHENTTTKFKIRLNTILKGPYSYADLPLKIEGLMGGVGYEVLIQDAEKSDCKLSFILPAIDCTVGTIDNNNQKSITAYFNAEKLIIQNSGSLDISEWRVYDAQGKLLNKQENLANPAEIQVSNWPRGIYFIQGIAGDQVITKGVMKM